MAPLPAPAEKPSHRVSDSQSHAKVRPPTQVAVFCAALWPNLQPALTGRPRRRAHPDRADPHDVSGDDDDRSGCKPDRSCMDGDRGGGGGAG